MPARTVKEADDVDHNGDKVAWIAPDRVLAKAILRPKTSAQHSHALSPDREQKEIIFR